MHLARRGQPRRGPHHDGREYVVPEGDGVGRQAAAVEVGVRTNGGGDRDVAGHSLDAGAPDQMGRPLKGVTWNIDPKASGVRWQLRQVLAKLCGTISGSRRRGGHAARGFGIEPGLHVPTKVRLQLLQAGDQLAVGALDLVVQGAGWTP